MKILIEEYAQVSAELILIFGGIIVIAIIALVTYNNYLKGLGSTINSSDPNSSLSNATNQIQGLKSLFTQS